MSGKEAAQFLEAHSTMVQLIAGSIATAITVLVFVYSTFQTQDATAKEISFVKERQDLILERLDKRLDRIENKLDTIKER